MKQLLKAAFPKCVKAYKQARLRKILGSAPTVSKSGIKYWGPQNYDSYEPANAAVITEELGNCDVLINIGANCGIYTIRAAATGKPVYAFEPIPENYAILIKNVQENQFDDRVLCFPFAAGEADRIVEIFGTGSSGSLLKGWNNQTEDGIPVQMVSVGDLLGAKLKDRTKLFLVDVEGAEYGALMGMQDILAEKSPNVFIVEIPTVEFMPGGNFNPNFVKVFDLFLNNGFAAAEISSDGKTVELNRAAIAEIVASNRYTGMMTKFWRR